MIDHVIHRQAGGREAEGIEYEPRITAQMTSSFTRTAILIMEEGYAYFRNI